ncbi:hypothetical protein [Kitasatospora viridis]|uniref:Uncharacterized protein n=1 Tax=Kitasatospora viridis TaxID=281105 RepID=A0A561TTB4_9ACTN|nr:hypothetical protein [Kitasatospora viridis]TWF90340.1 hypothetical protein FHX73_13384 [Kitasatospora viridis]
MARHRTLYDTALVFYGVLTALALTPPLTDFAKHVARAPQGCGFVDWMHRLLTITVLVQAAVWLHDLAVSIERTDTRQDTDLYGTAARTYWGGILMVVILAVLGAAVTRGTTAFLTASLAYLGWSLVFPALAARRRSEPLWGSPWKLRSPMRAQRADWRRGKEVELREDVAAVFSVREAAVDLVILGILVLLASIEPGPCWQFALALIWLLVVVLSITFHYCKEPQFYGV